MLSSRRWLMCKSRVVDVSLILEALKKSEQQRQREKAPSLQSIHQPVAVEPKQTVQPWWWLAVLVVICNLAFLGYWIWRQQQSVAPVASVATTSSTADESKEKVDSPAQSVTASKSVETQPEFTRIAPHAQPVQPETADKSLRVEEVSELPDNVRNNLPAMTFSFHVYSESPEQRTIIINDRRMREGDQISAGLQLQSITSDGVILLFEQHRIHISVLTEW